jgi:mRNA-degrading endonuclease toxin of MazEF toxin-antitoxin module
VLTPKEDGVVTECAVNVDNIQTVQKANLEEFLTTLSLERMRDVRAAIEFAPGFDALR